MKTAETLYRLAIALWFGGNALFTLVLTPLLFKTEARDTAARIVGTFFPGYFRWGLACGLIALITRFFMRGRGIDLAAAILVAMLAVTAVQAFYVEPRAAAIKREIGSFEATSKEHPLRRKFSKLHGISAVCNLAVLGGAVVLVILL
ncbi:MAG TPA: DUF4149 domain-containing protein [Desulfuromonadaceae bacterium]|jgi:hypothetical protein